MSDYLRSMQSQRSNDRMISAGSVGLSPRTSYRSLDQSSFSEDHVQAAHAQQMAMLNQARAQMGVSHQTAVHEASRQPQSGHSIAASGVKWPDFNQLSLDNQVKLASWLNLGTNLGAVELSPLQYPDFTSQMQTEQRQETQHALAQLAIMKRNAAQHSQQANGGMPDFSRDRTPQWPENSSLQLQNHSSNASRPQSSVNQSNVQQHEYLNPQTLQQYRLQQAIQNQGYQNLQQAHTQTIDVPITSQTSLESLQLRQQFQQMLMK